MVERCIGGWPPCRTPSAPATGCPAAEQFAYAAGKALQVAENTAAEREDRKPVELPHMVTHDLRHFYASALIARGKSAKQVQPVLGHASAVITLRIYAHAHLGPGEEDRTRSVMDAVLGGLRTGCGLVGDATRETAGQMA